MTTKLASEIVSAAIVGYEVQRRRLDAQIAELRQMLSPGATDVSTHAPKKRRRVSAAVRARIAAAQRERWTKTNAGSPKTAGTPGRKKRKLSAAGRRAIIEATKRRWAAFRKAQAA